MASPSPNQDLSDDEKVKQQKDRAEATRLLAVDVSLYASPNPALSDDEKERAFAAALDAAPDEVV